MATAQPKSVHVSGTVKGLTTPAIYAFIETPGVGRGYRFDSIHVNNGSFSADIPIDGLDIITIAVRMPQLIKKVGNGFLPSKAGQFMFVAEPGAKVHFEGDVSDFVNAYPSGTTANDELASLNRQIFPLINEAANKQVTVMMAKDTKMPAPRHTEDSVAAIGQQVLKLKKDFIANHPASPVSAWWLGDMMMRSEVNNEEAEKLFAGLSKSKLDQTRFYQEVAARVTGGRASQAGNIAPAIISSLTSDGRKFDLTGLRGKYVVLDFWGTWCGPCIDGMPQMKKYLEKYKNKLEIVGIAVESDDGSQWKKWLASKPEFNWHHLINDKKNNNLVTKYNVRGYPTKILLDPEGKIIARYVGETEELYKKLDEVL